MGLPCLDVIFSLAPPAVDLLVEPARRALLEFGDDEAGVGLRDRRLQRGK